MARQQLYLHWCDRCQAESQPGPATEALGWGRFALAHDDVRIGVELDAHLCTNCTSELVAWWHDKVPLPRDRREAETPSVRMRPALSIDDIAEMKREVQELLSLQIGTAWLAVAHNPDAFLDGCSPPLPITAIAKEADKLVSRIVRRHKLDKSPA